MHQIEVKSLGQHCPYVISLEANDQVGRGAHGVIRRAFNRQVPNQQLVAKVIQLDRLHKHRSAFQELAVIKQFPQAPHIVHYHKVKITSKHYVYIIMEYCSKGNMRELMVRRRGSFSAEEVWQFLCHFAEGYKVLLQHKVVHCDIKPQNILLGQWDNQLVYKISDFGLSEFVRAQSVAPKGTLHYLAPELLRQDQLPLSAMVDVYSLGVILFEMCFGRHPYISVYTSISHFCHQLTANNLTFPSSIYPSALTDLIASMLEKNPERRCTWQYLFNQTHGHKGPIKEVQCLRQQARLLKVVQISETYLQSLTYADLDLNKQLSTQSLLLVDHIEAEILSMRECVFFIDRLYARMTILSQQSQDLRRSSLLKSFANKLLLYNSMACQQLISNFVDNYAKVQSHELLKIITGKKYNYIQKILSEDFANISTEIREQELHYSLQRYAKQPGLSIQSELYEQCSLVIKELLKNGNLEECCQVGQLENYFGGEGESVLNIVRKNGKAMNQFKMRICNITKEQVKCFLADRYSLDL